MAVDEAGGTSPESEGVATDNSNVRGSLEIYLNFLTGLENHDDSKKCSRSLRKRYYPKIAPDMAAIFDARNPASPLAYRASQTALLLCDFQGFIVDRCGIGGMAALAKAKIMKDWAMAHGVMVVHSVVNVNASPPVTCKGAERINKMLAEVAHNKAAAEEVTEIAFGKKDGEYMVLKHPGVVSALRSGGASELLAEHGVKSIILCGLSTSGVVLRTTMPASDDGFIVNVIEDACADPVDGLHDTLAKTVLPSRAHVATAEEFMTQWSSVDTA